jgi:hypothetical protein
MSRPAQRMPSVHVRQAFPPKAAAVLLILLAIPCLPTFAADDRHPCRPWWWPPLPLASQLGTRGPYCPNDYCPKPCLGAPVRVGGCLSRFDHKPPPCFPGKVCGICPPDYAGKPLPRTCPYCGSRFHSCGSASPSG